MARGTGLPFPNSDATTQATPGFNADAFSSADAWSKVAQAGAQLRQIGVDQLEYATHQAHVGYLAEQETEIARKRIELRDQFENDPPGFDLAWTAYSDGKLSESEPWAVPHVRRHLGHEGNTAYGAILSERRGRDRQLDVQRINALIEQASGEVIGSAMAGTLTTPQGQAKQARLQAVMQSAVGADLMSQDVAELRLQDVGSRAGAEAVVKAIGDTYLANRARGLEAGPLAMKEAEDALLRTEDPRLAGLSEEQRYTYYRRATAEVRALESERKADLTVARQAKTEAEFAMTNGIRVAPDTIDGIVDQLVRAGGHADAARLRASAVRQDRLASFGRQPLAEQIRQHTGLRGALAPQFDPEVNDAIASAAQAAGVDAAMLRRFAQIESGGRPGEVTGSYKGLFQLSDSEFVRYGGGDIFNPVDNANAAARKLKAESAAFQARHGRAPTAADLYLTHQQGEGGYAAHIANPTRPAWENMLSTAEGKQKGEAWAKAAIWGNIPDQDKARFGSVENITSGQFVELWTRRVEGGVASTPGSAPPDLRLIVGERRLMSDRASDEWKKIVADLDRGVRPQPSALNTVIQAATLTGNHELLEEIGERVERFDAAQIIGRSPLTVQQDAVSVQQTRAASPEGLPPGQAAFLRDLERTAANTAQQLARDPIALAAQRFPERVTLPDPLNLADRDAAHAGLARRAGIARFVGENYGQTSVPVFGQSDRTQIAAAIIGPDKDQAATAFDLIASIPDENLSATLSTEEIKTAVSGAARSTDPARYNMAMMALDRLWGRAPLETDKIFGNDVVRELQDWQGLHRYLSEEQLADRLRQRSDPASLKQRRDAETAARQIIRTRGRNIDTLVSDLDPGIFVRGPRAPSDERTRDAALADYEALFAERYAATRDENAAHDQAIARMRLKWGRSELNGGRLTLLPPENHYPAINGSHDWLTQQLAVDLRYQETRQLTVADVRPPTETTPREFLVVADRVTESDIAGNRPPSYLVMAKTGGREFEMMRGADMRPLRYRWDVSGPTSTAREEFARQRAGVFGRNGSPLSPWSHEARFPRPTLTQEEPREPRPFENRGVAESRLAQANLSVTERGFLSALSTAESVGVGGTAVRLYNDFIQRGRTEPVTAGDFSESELDSFRRLATAKATETGKSTGVIKFGDYARYRTGAASNVLGEFRYSVEDDGSVSIEDTYDFNVEKGRPGDDNELLKILAAFVAPQRLAAVIGRKTMPDTKGGVPVNIRIPARR